MPDGYCTVGDIRRVKQEAELTGALASDNNQAVVDAITSQNQWLRKETDTHFYVEDGVTGDDLGLIPTTDRSRGPEEGDIPSTPHSQHSTLFSSRRDRYPYKTHGPFCRIPLDKHDVQALTALEVRDSTGTFTDWVAANDKNEGEDYRLYVEAGSAPSRSYVDVRAASLPALQHFDGGVRATYSYGEAELPPTVRRAVAMRATAQLLLDDEAALGIPENASLVSAESKVQALERQAEELLEHYR